MHTRERYSSARAPAAFPAAIEAKGIHCAVELEHEPESEGVALKKSGCHGFCERGPLVRIEPEGWLYTKVKVEDCEEIVEKTIVNGEHIEWF